MRTRVVLYMVCVLALAACGCGKLGIETPFKPSEKFVPIGDVLASEYLAGWTPVSDVSSMGGLYKHIQLRTERDDTKDARGQFIVKDRRHSYRFAKIPGYALRISCLLSDSGEVRIIAHKKEL